MPNRIVYTSHFEARLRRLVKKFDSLITEMRTLENELKQNPNFGTSLGSGLHKIRVSCESKGAGKSGGFRIITYLVNQTKEGTEINLITIYDKSEESNIKKAEFDKTG